MLNDNENLVTKPQRFWSLNDITLKKPARKYHSFDIVVPTSSNSFNASRALQIASAKPGLLVSLSAFHVVT